MKNFILTALLFLMMAAESEAASRRGRYRALISVCLAVDAKGAAPAPKPPLPTDACLNCRGTGRIGDGTVSVVCPVCDGTGKRKQQPPLHVQPAVIVEPMMEESRPERRGRRVFGGRFRFGGRSAGGGC